MKLLFYCRKRNECGKGKNIFIKVSFLGELFMYSKSPKVEFTFEWSHNQPITTYFISATHPYLDTLAIKSWLTANRPDYSPLSHSAKLCWRNLTFKPNHAIWKPILDWGWRLEGWSQKFILLIILHFSPTKTISEGTFNRCVCSNKTVAPAIRSSHALSHGAFQCDEVPEEGLKLCPHQFNLNYLLSFSFNKMYSYSIVCQG